MKALVYHGPNSKACEDVPDATVQDPTDVVVRVDTTTICGTDLHILQGDVPAVTDGLGVDVAIEAVGYPETLLTAASLVRPGGTIANVGVHGTPVELPMQDM